MKRKIEIIISIIMIILIAFSINNLAVEPKVAQYTTEQKAIREIADAYYRRETNGQYCSHRQSFIYSPEEATSQHTLYSVCSNFTYNVYKEAFGIQIQGGYASTHRIIAYGKEYYDADNIKTNDVIEYWERTVDETGKSIYKDNKGNDKDINLDTLEGRKAYATLLLKNYNLQVGDIICTFNIVSNAGHALMVYEIMYDEEGNPIDAIIRESASKFEKNTTKISKGLSYRDTFNEKNNIHEGTFRELHLSTSNRISPNANRNSLIFDAKDTTHFTIIRPLLQDENGDYTGKYYYSTYQFQTAAPTKYVCTGRTLRDYDITNVAQYRLNYSGIYIEKTVDVFNNSVVNLEDELEYTIKIKNNSDATYNSFEVVENIPEYVQIVDSANGNVQSSKITWTISGLDANESKVIKYKVKVKNTKENIGKEIISTGTVAGIPSSTVNNIISSNLKENEKLEIKNKAQAMINEKNYNGKDLISKMYKDSLNVELNLENFDITDLIKVRNNDNYYPDISSENCSIYLNDENSFYNMILSNYYGAVYTPSSGKTSLKQWENASAEVIGRSERADNIYKENFQTGDVLIYKNTQAESENTLYKTEDGAYYLIYLSQDDAISVNGESLYGFIGLDENNNIHRLYKSESEEYSIEDLRTLLGKDYYVILRPALAIDIVPMELQVSYSNKDITNQNVTVSITSNEEMLPIDGWLLSEDKKQATKTYTENATEVLEVSDYAGNETEATIDIKNIDKIAPEVEIEYSTLEKTHDPVIVTIKANEEIKDIDGWTRVDTKILKREYSENTEGIITVTIEDLAGNKTQKEYEISNIIEVITIESQKYVINNMIITMVDPSTTVTKFYENITTNTTDKKVLNNDKELLEQDIVTTNSTLLLDDEYSYTIIVRGDLNGDGQVTISDLAITQKIILKSDTPIGEVYFAAGDLDNNKEITISDLARIQKFILTKAF